MTTLPPACQTELIFVAYFKRELVSGELSAGERLRILEWLDGCACGPVTGEAIAVIEPGNEVFAQIITEAVRAAAASEDGQPCFDILERAFNDLARINPSLGQAVALCRLRAP